jgi:hypothetical protein
MPPDAGAIDRFALGRFQPVEPRAELILEHMRRRPQA